MKQNFYFKSLLIALFVLFGGGVFAQQTQTLKFEVNTVSTIKLVDGILPEGVTATYKSTVSK